MDDDLDGFVVHQADDDEIGDEEEGMAEKFRKDLEEDDKKL